jgi:hypothetical protein
MTLNTPQYDIRIRDASLNLQGSLKAWTDGDLYLRMNDVGTWVLVVRADDPLRQYFVRGAGVIITRDRGDGTGAQTLLSGPIWAMERHGVDNTFVLAGVSDEWWLKARRALPIGGRPYMEAVLLDTPTRYYRLGESSGTSAVDISGNGQNGTYVASPMLGVVGAVSGDPDTAITLNGTTQSVTVPTTGLPSGNVPATVECWFKIASNPAVQVVLLYIGGTTAGQRLSLALNAAGTVIASNGTVNTTASSAVTTGVWHHAVGVYDGANLQCYVDGVSTGAAVAGSTTITYGSAGLGINSAGTVFFPGSLDECTIFATALTSAQISAHKVAGAATHAAYDTRTGVASTVIRNYVNANLVAATNIDRNMATLTLAADPAVGTSVTGNARGDELLALIQQLASSGGDIGFRLVQTANGVLTFTVYAPNDKSATAKFSQDLQNLFDFSYALAGPNANYVAAWGGGTGAARTSVSSRDATSITNWGLVEEVLDARDTSDTLTLRQRALAEINAQTELTNLAISPRDTDTLQYGRDYNLGDIIAVEVDGNLILNKVRSVHIELKNPGDQELVTPGIGNPSQGEVARWFDAGAARAQALSRVQQQLSRLSTGT